MFRRIFYLTHSLHHHPADKFRQCIYHKKPCVGQIIDAGFRCLADDAGQCQIAHRRQRAPDSSARSDGGAGEGNAADFICRPDGSVDDQ